MVNVMERIKSVYSDVLLWFGLVLLKVICLSWWHFFFFFFFFFAVFPLSARQCRQRQNSSSTPTAPNISVLSSKCIDKTCYAVAGARITLKQQGWERCL